MKYDFLITPDEPPKNFGAPPTPTITLKDFTPKMFMKDVGRAYQAVGGLTWLITQATAAPADFMKLLQKMMPKQLDLDLMEGITVKLIDQFGQTIEIAKPATGGRPTPLSLPQVDDEIATGGSLTPTVRVLDTYND